MYKGQKKTLAGAAGVAVEIAETFTFAVFHAPSAYSQNLTAKAIREAL